MSKDIRSFFLPKKAHQPKIQEDDDIIPESPDVQIKNRKKDKKKRRVLDDSDEEIKSTKTKTDDKSKKLHSSSKDKKPKLTEVKPVDLFGTGPIKRTEPLVKKKKNTETGIHSDDEFEKSLLEIDNAEFELQITGCDISEKPFEKEKSSSKSEQYLTINEESTINDISKERQSRQINHANKDKAKTSKDNKSTKSDNNLSQSNTNDSNNDKKAKMENSKRKFAEFIENDSPDHISDKKKKLNDHVDGENLDKPLNKHGNIHNEAVVLDVSTQSNKRKKISDNHEKESKNQSMSSELDSTVTEDVDMDKKTTKKKLNKSLNESLLTDEERHERRIASAALYKSYLNRSGPKHLGAKEIPEGSPDCLKECAFVLTGVLDSFEKDEVAAAINKYGGSVKSGVTKKVTHVIAGDDAGPAKMAKAQELGIKIINEDEFLQMITDRSNKKDSSKVEIKKDIKKDKTPHKDNSKHSSKGESSRKDKKTYIDSNSKIEIKSEHISRDKSKSPKVKEKTPMKSKSPKKFKEESPMKTKTPKKVKEEAPMKSISEKIQDIDNSENTSAAVNGISKTSNEKNIAPANFNMWVEKYKPQNIKQIIGQQGDASNVKKLINWLTKWYVNRKAKLPKPSPWAKNDDGGYYKAVLLSGPPGVGKTTTVSLVCKELGFDMVEFNASDTRNKTLIREQIGELLTTTSLSGFAKGETGKQAITKKHVLVMDEVDGMAGNEDRGGLQELIGLIKSASVPIICMCNDRNSQKMRSLVNYCYDLRFNRPRVDQIKSAMMSICFKEGIKIPPDVLSQLITSANQDVRQTLNLLSMWAVDPTLMDADRLRKDAQTTKKDIKLGPWEAIRKVFSAEDHKTMSINDKSDLFFYDYSLSPLFVQENYLQVAPHCPKHEVLQRISNTADSISLGDLVDARIRGSQAWSLLPLQAMYASVIPGHLMSGHMTGQIQFPGWLGKNSRASKMRRLCQEIHAHTRLSTSGSKSSVFLDYSSHIRDAIINPLIKDRVDGIERSLEVLESYHLLREDLDSLVELSVWPGQRNPTILIDSKVKAAMTRNYNKKAAALPYAPGVVKKSRGIDHEEAGEDEIEDEEPPDSDPENDALIKKKKTKEAEKHEKPSSSKGKSSKPTSKKKKET